MWAQDEPTVFISKEQYLAMFDGCEIRPHEQDGEVVGATVVKGPEFHFATFGTKWKLTRADIRAYLQPLLDEFGYVLTKTPLEDNRQQRFNIIIGFKPVGEDEFYLHYRLENLCL